MSTGLSISEHYARDNLLAAIQKALNASGISLEQVTVDDLGPVDEFHTGGRVATAHLLDKITLHKNSKVLDIGCGIGGTSRFLADRYQVSVRGIDLTPTYVETAKVLNEWVSLTNKIETESGSATSLPYADNAFDAAVMLHVGMNIADKALLFSEVNRVLRSGARFCLYDVMKKSDDSFDFPVPWATDDSMSHLEHAESYAITLAAQGFTIENIEGRGDFAKSFFKKMREANQPASTPPPLGLHVLMGPEIKQKMKNFSQAVFDGTLEPTEIVAIKR